MERRKLQLQDPSQVASELDRLRRGGYRPMGQWTLGQICQHLAGFVRGSLDGFDYAPGWATRTCAGRVVLTRMLTSRKLPASMSCPPSLLPKPADQAHDAVEIENYLDLFLRRFPYHNGQYHRSPTLGDMDMHAWMDYHLIHAEHHLSLLMPANEITVTLPDMPMRMIPPSSYVIRTAAMA